jgi:hypothetical protein
LSPGRFRSPDCNPSAGHLLLDFLLLPGLTEGVSPVSNQGSFCLKCDALRAGPIARSKPLCAGPPGFRDLRPRQLGSTLLH